MNDGLVDLFRQLYPQGEIRPWDEEQQELAEDFLEQLTSDDRMLQDLALILGKNKDSRFQRTRRLLVNGGELSVQPLCQIYELSNRKGRGIILDICKAIGNSAIDVLLLAIDDADDGLRAIATRYIGEFNSEPVRSTLNTLVKDKNFEVRKNASIALSGLIPPDCNPLIELINKEDDVSVKRQLITRLDSCPELGRPILKDLLTDRDRDLRLDAVKTLSKIGGVSIVDNLEFVSLNDTDAAIQQLAINGLGAIGEPALGSLSKISKDLSVGERERIIAVRNLFNCGKSALECLNEILNDDSLNIRVVAVQSISNIRPESLELFEKALKDPAREVRIKALNGLLNYGEPALDLITSVVLDDRDKLVKLRAVEIIGLMGEQGLPSLIRVLENKHNQVRERAINQLEKLGDKCLPAILPGLNSPYDDVRVGCIQLLKDMEPNPDLILIPVLSEALDSEHVEVQEVAAQKLVEIGQPAQNLLIKCLDSKHQPVVLPAIEGLKRIGTLVCENKLFSMVNHDDEICRQAALRALFTDFTITENNAAFYVRALESPHKDITTCFFDETGRLQIQDNSLAFAIIDELIIRKSGLPDSSFVSETTSRALCHLIGVKPTLSSPVLDKLGQTAFQYEAPVRGRVVSVARSVFPQQFPQYIKENDNNNEIVASDIMRLFGGSEATFYMTESHNRALEEFKKPLIKLEKEGFERWKEVNSQTKKAFYLSMIMTGLIFVFGVILASVGLYLLINADDPWVKAGGSAISAATAIGSMVSRRFWRDPVEHIRSYSTQQARVEAAFIGYMNRIGQIRLIFEKDYSQDAIPLEDLERYQRLMGDAAAQISKELNYVDTPYQIEDNQP